MRLLGSKRVWLQGRLGTPHGTVQGQSMQGHAVSVSHQTVKLRPCHELVRLPRQASTDLTVHILCRAANQSAFRDPAEPRMAERAMSRAG